MINTEIPKKILNDTPGNKEDADDREVGGNTEFGKTCGKWAIRIGKHWYRTETTGGKS